MEALLTQLPKTEGQPRIYRRHRNMINRSSVASPLASLLASYLTSYIASYLALPMGRNRNAVPSQCQLLQRALSDKPMSVLFTPHRPRTGSVLETSTMLLVAIV
jgi:hypothetical protein